VRCTIAAASHIVHLQYHIGGKYKSNYSALLGVLKLQFLGDADKLLFCAQNACDRSYCSMDVHCTLSESHQRMMGLLRTLGTPETDRLYITDQSICQ